MTLQEGDVGSGAAMPGYHQPLHTLCSAETSQEQCKPALNLNDLIVFEKPVFFIIEKMESAWAEAGRV